MNKSKLLIALATAGLVSTQAVADAGADNWSISGWVNEGMTYADDGVGSDIVQLTDNGNTLGTRVTLAGSTDLPNTGLNAGFEIILEPRSGVLGFGSGKVKEAKQTVRIASTDNGDDIGVLGNSINISGGFGKVTVGLQSMPTDNIGVLEDPSLTLWASISPVFRGNGIIINSGNAGGNAAGSAWGDFLNCYTNTGLRGTVGIGIDCNGTYLRGIRYDLPAFGPVTVAVGHANDDVYDIAVKYKDDLAGIKAQLAVGYAMNQSNNNVVSEAENFQVQAGLMDPGTGIFGTIAYQHETAELSPGVKRALSVNPAFTLSDDTDAWWMKVGVKRAFNSLGDTSMAFQYGSYNDQYGLAEALVGVTGSEVTRMGLEVNQYFGSRLILYGVWENLELDTDCSSDGLATCANYNAAKDLDTFTAGLTFFF